MLLEIQACVRTIVNFIHNFPHTAITPNRASPSEYLTRHIPEPGSNNPGRDPLIPRTARLPAVGAIYSGPSLGHLQFFRNPPSPTSSTFRVSRIHLSTAAFLTNCVELLPKAFRPSPYCSIQLTMASMDYETENGRYEGMSSEIAVLRDNS